MLAELLAPGHEGGGLAFGKDGAHAVDLDALVGLQGKDHRIPPGEFAGPVAMNSRNLPVPAAQRSFISNLATLPLRVRAMTLVSWPPMSRTVRASGAQMLGPQGIGLNFRDGGHPPVSDAPGPVCGRSRWPRWAWEAGPPGVGGTGPGDQRWWAALAHSTMRSLFQTPPVQWSGNRYQSRPQVLVSETSPLGGPSQQLRAPAVLGPLPGVPRPVPGSSDAWGERPPGPSGGVQGKQDIVQGGRREMRFSIPATRC